MTFKERLKEAFPVFSDIFKRNKTLIQSKTISGGSAGKLACSGIQKGDELISVLNLTDSTDITSEFRANTDDGIIVENGYISNAGGTSTASDTLYVLWYAWK